MIQNSVHSIRPGLPKGVPNSANTDLTNPSPRVTRYTAESHVKALRTILIKVAPAKIACLYELHCLDQLLKQVFENKIPLGDCIPALKGILKNIHSNCPEVAAQINEKIKHRLSKYDAETVGGFAADLALHLERDSDGKTLSVIFNSAVAQLLPETCVSYLKHYLDVALSKYEPKTAKKEVLDNIRDEFKNSLASMTHLMEQSLSCNTPDRNVCIKHFYKTYLNNFFAEFLADKASGLTTKRARNFKTFLQEVVSELNDLSNSQGKSNCRLLYKKKLEGELFAALKTFNNSSPPETDSKKLALHIDATTEILQSLQDLFTYQYEFIKKDFTAALADEAKECIAVRSGLEFEKDIPPEVGIWFAEAHRILSNVDEAIERFEEIERENTLCNVKSSVLTQFIVSIDKVVNEAVRRPDVVQSEGINSDRAVEKSSPLHAAERAAEDKQLLTLINRFVEIKSQKFQAERELHSAMLEKRPTAVDSAHLKIEQLESRMKYTLKEMERNHGSEARMLTIAAKEQKRLKSEAADLRVQINKKKQEKESLINPATILQESDKLDKEIITFEDTIHEINREKNRLELFLKPTEDGGLYRSGEFESFFRKS